MKKSPPRQTPSGLNGVYHFAIHTAGPVFCQRQTYGQSATPVRQSDEASIQMNFPCQGQWWLPGSPDKSVFGPPTFPRRDGAVLSLADSLSADKSELEHAIIVGQTAAGAYVTLLHAIRTEAPLFRLTATYPCSYHATFLITGAAFDSEADMRFSLWQIRVPEMRTWVGKR